MSRNKDYQRLLNSKRWKQLREWKLNESPLCEMCAAKGFDVAAVDVHHKIPCESARTIQEMRERKAGKMDSEARQIKTLGTRFM